MQTSLGTGWAEEVRAKAMSGEWRANTGDKKLDEKLAAAECLKAANAVLGEKDALVSMTFTQIASQLSG